MFTGQPLSNPNPLCDSSCVKVTSDRAALTMSTRPAVPVALTSPGAILHYPGDTLRPSNTSRYHSLSARLGGERTLTREAEERAPPRLQE
ncbi:hypothetical protein AAFF_G00132850 [Aldrovandia affinis]|uniref:Uncharacterized protein n=1 Tax=Aldrovandia affinis TaxID=143900 RepID=A0AAD7W962_9TELE|nr:hypothetical protein AAFF_G00132850 [Aldrovandia affinis]